MDISSIVIAKPKGAQIYKNGVLQFCSTPIHYISQLPSQSENAV